MIVEVTAQLDGPVMADQHVHLDGLLLWSAAQDLGLPVPLRGTALADLPEITIPVEAETRAGLTIYLSSAWVLPDDVGAYRHDWTRRRDAGDVERLARTFVPACGPGRDLHRHGYGVAATSVRWHVATNDAAELERLLQRVRYLGRLRSHGCGAVSSWTVTPTGLPRAHALVGGGRAARALPVAWLRQWDGPTHRLAYAPPYWHPERHVECVVPGTPIELEAP